MTTNTTHNDSLPDIENLTGSDHNDILAGDRRNNEITGNAGNDTLYGGPGGGDDVIETVEPVTISFTAAKVMTH